MARQSRGLPGRTNCRRHLSNLGTRHDDPAASLRTSARRWLELAGAPGQRHPMVPPMLQQPVEDYDLSALARLTSGSAPLPAQVAEDLRKRLPQVEIAEGYGCTDRRGHLHVAARPGPGGQRGQARAGRRSSHRAGRLVGGRNGPGRHPREVRLVDAIPLTSVMKTDRKLLRAMLTAG